MSDGGQGERGPDPDEPELGAAFVSSEAAARAWGADVDDDTAARRAAAAAQPVGPDQAPTYTSAARPAPGAPPVEGPLPPIPPAQFVATVPPGPQQPRGTGQRRTVFVDSTGDEGIDAMLMCRAIFETLPDYEQRRLLTYLGDRYGGR
jgi:hypothetical protein